MSVEIKQCLADVWTLVGSNTTLKLITIQTSGPNRYLQTNVPAGDPAPVGDANATGLPKDGIISNSSAIDIYVKAKGADGSVRVSGKITETVDQSNTSPIVDIYLSQKLKTDITLTVPTVVDEFVYNVSAGHGFTGGADEYLEIWENGRFAQAEVESVATNAITVALPVERVFTSAAVVMRTTINMAIDGTVPKIFSFTPIGSDWDISRFILNMNHGSGGDDSKWGSITALTNGIYARKKNTVKGTFGNLFNAKINADLRERAYDLTYSDKAGAGIFGTSIRRSFGGKDKNDAVVRVKGSVLEEIQVFNRDNLSTLLRFHIVLQGSAVSG